MEKQFTHFQILEILIILLDHQYPDVKFLLWAAVALVVVMVVMMDLVEVVQVICIIMLQQQFQLDQKQWLLVRVELLLDLEQEVMMEPHQHLP